MNEIALHRGSSPHLNTIDIFVDGQHLTEAVVGFSWFFDASRRVLTTDTSPTVLSSPRLQAQPHTPYLLVAQLSIHP